MINKNNNCINLSIDQTDKDEVIEFFERKEISYDIISEDDPILEFDGEKYYSLSDILLSHSSGYPEYIVSGKSSLISEEKRGSFSSLEDIVEFVVDYPFEFRFLSKEYIINSEMESLIDGYSEISIKARRLLILNNIPMNELDNDLYNKELTKILNSKDKSGNALIHKSIKEKNYSFFGRLINLGANLNLKRGHLYLDSNKTAQDMIDELIPSEKTKFLSYLL